MKGRGSLVLLAIVAVVLLLVVVFTVRSVATRLIVVVLLGDHIVNVVFAILLFGVPQFIRTARSAGSRAAVPPP